jgi:hypothetical protein
MQKLLLISGLVTANFLVGFALPALAQNARSYDPNLNKFYMARQQWQITDDTPMIRDSTGAPVQAGGAVGGQSRGPTPLPRASFQTYYQPTMPGMRSGLPKVENGVPKQSLPPVQAKRKDPSANAGGVKYAPKKASVPSAPSGSKTYAPYKGYSGPTAGSSPSSGTGYGGGSTSTSTQVRGVLHWARGRKN